MSPSITAMVSAIGRSVRILNSPAHSPRWRPSRCIFVRCRPGALWIAWFRSNGICWRLLCTAIGLRSTKTIISADIICSCLHITDSPSSGMSISRPRAYENCPASLYVSLRINTGWRYTPIKLRTQFERNVVPSRYHCYLHPTHVPGSGRRLTSGHSWPRVTAQHPTALLKSWSPIIRTYGTLTFRSIRFI